MNLEAMRNIDIKSISEDELVDIREVVVDSKKPVRKRLDDYIHKIKNPYCYKYADYIIKVSFAYSNVTLEDKLQELIFSIADSDI